MITSEMGDIHSAGVQSTKSAGTRLVKAVGRDEMAVTSIKVSACTYSFN